MKKRTLVAIALWTLFGVAGIDLAFAQDDHGNTRETATVRTWRPERDVVIGLPEGAPKTEFSPHRRELRTRGRY